ncbi:hypothetical protein L1887_33524 [Cichorium endivia]|nr:hypothetical protein L1887_33524 [Cichorium endivia]
MHFTGGGFCDAAIAEGLGEALLMFPPQNEHSIGVQKHCILVAASNLYPLSKMQKIEATDDNEAQSESCLSDAETVAKSFPQCCVSLSVICPEQLPKLKAIYNAGKRNPSAADPTIDIVKNPHYLVLISEAFMEARAALSRSGITNLPSQSPIKVEPTMVTSMPPVPTMQISSPLSVPQDMLSSNVGPPQQTTPALQSAKPKYVKIWEGELFGLRQDQPVFVTRLEAYQKASDSESLAADWPRTMQIVRLISQDHMNNKRYEGNADFLVYRAMNQHGFLNQLQEKKLCAVIQLPSQTLLLSVSDKVCRLIGMVFPEVDYDNLAKGRSRIPNLSTMHDSNRPLDYEMSRDTVDDDNEAFILNAINMSFHKRLSLARKILFPIRNSKANIAKRNINQGPRF